LKKKLMKKLLQPKWAKSKLNEKRKKKEKAT
jgi:hypothetical protein